MIDFLMSFNDFYMGFYFYGYGLFLFLFVGFEHFHNFN